MGKYWLNASGYYDPTAAETIQKEQARKKQIHNTIKKVKKLLEENDLELAQRILLKDKRTKKLLR